MNLKMLTASLRVEPDCSDSLEPFGRRVAETIAWCVPRVISASPRECLRSHILHTRPGKWRTLERENDYHRTVLSVANARKKELLPTIPEPSLELADGRLLVYFPNADLCDGAAEAESHGFFDVFNAPPWGTWIAFVSEADETSVSYSEYLIAWVPSAFIGLAAAGILVNPEECIRWLDEAGVSFAKLL